MKKCHRFLENGLTLNRDKQAEFAAESNYDLWSLDQIYSSSLHCLSVNKGLILMQK